MMGFNMIPEKNIRRWYIRRAERQLRYDMNGKSQMQGGKNWILTKDINANQFFWDSHWLEIWTDAVT
jgi:hypothetical protein